MHLRDQRNPVDGAGPDAELQRGAPHRRLTVQAKKPGKARIDLGHQTIVAAAETDRIGGEMEYSRDALLALLQLLHGRLQLTPHLLGFIGDQRRHHARSKHTGHQHLKRQKRRRSHLHPHDRRSRCKKHRDPGGHRRAETHRRPQQDREHQHHDRHTRAGVPRHERTQRRHRGKQPEHPEPWIWPPGHRLPNIGNQQQRRREKQHPEHIPRQPVHIGQHRLLDRKKVVDQHPGTRAQHPQRERPQHKKQSPLPQRRELHRPPPPTAQQRISDRHLEDFLQRQRSQNWPRQRMMRPGK